MNTMKSHFSLHLLKNVKRNSKNFEDSFFMCITYLSFRRTFLPPTFIVVISWDKTFVSVCKKKKNNELIESQSYRHQSGHTKQKRETGDYRSYCRAKIYTTIFNLFWLKYLSDRRCLKWKLFCKRSDCDCLTWGDQWRKSRRGSTQLGMMSGNICFTSWFIIKVLNCLRLL